MRASGAAMPAAREQELPKMADTNLQLWGGVLVCLGLEFGITSRNKRFRIGNCAFKRAGKCCLSWHTHGVLPYIDLLPCVELQVLPGVAA